MIDYSIKNFNCYINAMETVNNKYQTYDPRLKMLVAKSGRADLFAELNIPRSTATTWIIRGVQHSIPRHLRKSIEENGMN